MNHPEHYLYCVDRLVAPLAESPTYIVYVATSESSKVITKGIKGERVARRIVAALNYVRGMTVEEIERGRK